jgi:DNA mismatch repair protein MSH3
MAIIVDLPRTVMVALAHVLKHLAAFRLTDALMDASVFCKFTDRTHMLLNGNTLIHLFVYTPVVDSQVFSFHEACLTERYT